MAMEVRLSMRKIREILRLRFDCKLTIRQISVSIRVSTGAVTKYLNLFGQSGLSWPLPTDMDDTALINQLSPESAKRRHQVRILVKMNALSGKREHLRFPKHCPPLFLA